MNSSTSSRMRGPGAGASYANAVEAVCFDQAGSRFMQRKITETHGDELDEILTCVSPLVPALSRHAYGNYIVQKVRARHLPGTLTPALSADLSRLPMLLTQVLLVLVLVLVRLLLRPTLP